MTVPRSISPRKPDSIDSLPIDRAHPVRDGEGIEPTRLVPWLRSVTGDDFDDADFAIEQFPGGHSDLTDLVHIRDRDDVRRRPPFGSKVCTALELVDLLCTHAARHIETGRVRD